MYLKALHTLLVSYIMYVLSFDDTNVYGQASQEMLDQGRAQYQLLHERGNLPQYGTCWKRAVLHVQEGCRTLSEETQSDIALHLTNCFLEMSGHEMYKCEADKKPNLRGICISSMSDRAFNVYTEFYTHTQNICWFLRGQIWQETISENTLRVGRQLERSAENQEQILNKQQESIELQEKLLKYGLVLEKIMEDFYLSTQRHQEILSAISLSLGTLQSWLLGEISWLDTLVFYVTAGALILFFTSSSRTAGARLICISFLTLNATSERLICHWLSKRLASEDIKSVHAEYNFYIWICRYLCLFLCLLVILLKAYFYRDYAVENNILLRNVYNQILSMSESTNGSLYCRNGFVLKSGDSSLRFEDDETHKSRSQAEECNGFVSSHEACKENISNRYVRVSSRRQITPLREVQNGIRYNLRSKQGTPDLVV